MQKRVSQCAHHKFITCFFLMRAKCQFLFPPSFSSRSSRHTSGSPAFLALLSGNRRTICESGEVSVVVEARMVPASDEMKEFEQAISVEEVVAMTLPDGAALERAATTRKAGDAAAYVFESADSQRRAISLFSVSLLSTFAAPLTHMRGGGYFSFGARAFREFSGKTRK